MNISETNIPGYYGNRVIVFPGQSIGFHGSIFFIFFFFFFFSAEGITCLEETLQVTHPEQLITNNNSWLYLWASPEIGFCRYTEKAAKEAGYEIEVVNSLSAFRKSQCSKVIKMVFVKVIYDAKIR